MKPRTANRLSRIKTTHGATLTGIFWAYLVISTPVLAQDPGPSQQTAPGDRMIEAYLRVETEKLETNFLGDTKTLGDWKQRSAQFRQEYFDMLGLWPMPAREALHATITRTLDRGEYQVDMLQYQSRPGLYVTGNLYRPSKVGPGERLPAILYVCGHAPRGRNGNKTAYQSHGIWFARHGYVCLMLDTLQLGEIPGIHHGTYREGRWWWLSRGYTPAGVECWNGMRGIDYLVSRPDVDPDRIGVTGISGGGAATFWIAAADERVKVAVPVSGLTDLLSYVPDQVVNGHCDCMFLYNTYQWPWARIPSLIAPRPLLYINSDHDSLFPIEGDERVINHLERVYSLFGAGDVVDSLISIGGHAYRQDIRQGAFRFLNTYLKADPRPVLDTEVDLVTGDVSQAHPIPPEQLRVFPKDSDLPSDARNGRIDEEFVPMRRPGPPKPGLFPGWKDGLVGKLRTLAFHHFPARITPARPVATQSSGLTQLETEPGIVVPLRELKAPTGSTNAHAWLVAADAKSPDPTWWKSYVNEQDAVYVIQPRGVGGTRWTQRNPPNYVERAHYLLGRSVDSGRVWDLVAAARYLKARGPGQTKLRLAGEGAAGVLAAYAALLEPDVDEVFLIHPQASHMDGSAPALLNVLRICDIPDVIGMLAPRPVTLVSDEPDWRQVSARIYTIAGAEENFSIRSQ